MKTFFELGLSETLNVSLKKMEYSTPTPIQAQAIPLALLGHDILGSAQTGTGKTAAFSIPLVEALIRNPQSAALILTPTRELAKQVLTVVKQLLNHDRDIKTAFIIGGESMSEQIRQLRANPRVIVGTPGRINDHLRRKSINLSNTNFLVLDETDRMLDMGFGVQLDEIAKYLPRERQTLMFSATMPKGIIAVAAKYLNKPERISVGETNVVAKNIKQEVIRIEQGAKYEELKAQLLEREGSVIIFIKTKHAADKMATNLRRDGFTADALHGDLKQNKREKVMRAFREMNFRILVATDIAARGLDVPHIRHVINYDLPQVAEDYIHRMGRTARAGAEGSALCFISQQDGRKWHAIERLLNPDMPADNSFAPKKKSRGHSKPFKSKPFSNNRFERDESQKRPFKKKHTGRPDRKYAEGQPQRSERSEHGQEQRTEKRQDQRQEHGYSANKPRGQRPERPAGKFVESNGEKRSENRGDQPYSQTPKGKKPFNKSKSRPFAGNSEGKPQGNSNKISKFVTPAKKNFKKPFKKKAA
jgi:superfamily II DNA/RNA helicase